MARVSVIIPCYNTGHYLAKAVQSVLDQTYDDFEVIIVDDGSTDNTAEVARQFDDRRVRFICQVNKGLAGARNAGISLTTGEYVAFLDADDLFLPHKLATQVQLLDDRPEVGLVAAGYQFIDENGRLLRKVKPWIHHPSITLESILDGLAPVHTILLRRSWIEQAGGFDEHFLFIEDTDLWHRLALADCVMKWSPSVVCQYRVHADNASRSPEKFFGYFRTVLDKTFADPRMPDELRARKSEWLARLDLLEASRLLACGRDETARERIQHAICLDPLLSAHNGQRLAEMIAGLQSDVWGTSRFEGFALDVFQGSLPSLARTVAAVRAKIRFYTAYDERQPAAIRRAWFEVARHDPRWLSNRGGWSILHQSVTGFKRP